MTSRPVAVDIYCGCGAVTEGLKNLFRVAAAIDNDPLASASYRANHPDTHLFECDVRSLDPLKVRTVLGNRNVDLLVVCAPCQPFSSQNRNKRGDERVELILQALRFAKVLKPRLIFFENVRGLSAPRHNRIILKLRSKLESLGFSQWLGPFSIDAADHGVPQRRHRCIMMAAPSGQPLPSIPDATTPNKCRVTVKKAIGDLQALSSGESSAVDRLHFSRTHHPIALNRFKHIPKDGGSRFDLPPSLELKCHKDHDGHPDVYGRMAWDEVAPTLTSGCTDATRGRFVHPRDDRSITLREAARLQTFPDEYRFSGCSQAIARQIGNAVPVAFMQTLGQAMFDALTHDKKTA